MMTKQVVSKQRVAERGEVFTSQREVNAMLDLVKQETERIDSRFLEPACGTGNFLNEILRRKLQVVEKKYRRSQIEYERYSVLAVSSVYGIDIQEDNVVACRQRLLGLFSEKYTGIYKNKAKITCIQAVQFILSKNIIHGNALTLKREGENQSRISFLNGRSHRAVSSNGTTFTLMNYCPMTQPNAISPTCFPKTRWYRTRVKKFFYRKRCTVTGPSTFSR